MQDEKYYWLPEPKTIAKSLPAKDTKETTPLIYYCH